jgi:hypothetical protein
MIFSFSVPENERNMALVKWYRTFDAQERSRKFREIFLSYLGEAHHNIEQSHETRISQPRIPNYKLERIAISRSNDDDIDLDSRLDSIGILGGELN